MTVQPRRIDWLGERNWLSKRDTASQAMRVYARQAKNRGLEIDAAEIRMRANQRLGELSGRRRKRWD